MFLSLEKRGMQLWKSIKSGTGWFKYIQTITFVATKLWKQEDKQHFIPRFPCWHMDQGLLQALNPWKCVNSDAKSSNQNTVNLHLYKKNIRCHKCFVWTGFVYISSVMKTGILCRLPFSTRDYSLTGLLVETSKNNVWFSASLFTLFIIIDK